MTGKRDGSNEQLRTSVGQHLAAGTLIPTTLSVELVCEEIARRYDENNALEKLIVLDGFPRCVEQIKELFDFMPKVKAVKAKVERLSVVRFNCDKDTARGRFLARHDANRPGEGEALFEDRFGQSHQSTEEVVKTLFTYDSLRMGARVTAEAASPFSEDAEIAKWTGPVTFDVVSVSSSACHGN